MSWDHSADYPLPKSKDWTSAGGAAGFTKTYKLGEEHSFLADHVVDGRILMPVRYPLMSSSIFPRTPCSSAYSLYQALQLVVRKTSLACLFWLYSRSGESDSAHERRLHRTW